MSKLNSTKKTNSMYMVGEIAGKKTNKAPKQDSIALLRRLVLANLLWENIAYCDGESITEEISRLIPLCKPEDVYNLALESRNVQKLRHTPLFLASEMCKHEGTRPYVKDLLPKIITRADMLTDFMAIYWNYGKCPLANVVKKGLGNAFHNFNEYKLAKYDRDAPIKLRDIMFLCHPNPINDAEKELFKKVADRTLKTPDTWEVALSAGADKKETWERLISERKIGGKAMLMNLRNMNDAGVSATVIMDGLNTLNSSMLLPLDFYKAAVLNPSYEGMIEYAMLESYKNLPKLPGKTLFIVDTSGSMDAHISNKSRFTRMECAGAMAMLAKNQCENCTIVATAGDDNTHVESHVVVPENINGFKLLKYFKSLRDQIGYGGIFTRQCLKACKKEIGSDFDRIIVFSDSQDCDYEDRRIPAPFAKRNYICDVSCERHGINFKGRWNAEISGWSEHFLTYIAAYEGLENKFSNE